MKKFLSVIVCAILVGISAILGVDTEKVTCGAGNGVNEQIKNVSEVADVLESFGFSPSMRLTALSDSDDEKEYTSATIIFESVGGVSSSSTWSGNTYGSSSMNMYMDKTMTCYFTEDASYYDVEAYIRSSSMSSGSGESESNSSVAKIGFQMYIDSEHVYIRFSEFSVTSNTTETLPDFKKVLNKWIDATEGGGSSVTSVNDDNYEQMSIIGKYVRNYEEDGFTRSGDVYEMKNDEVKSLCRELFRVVGGSSVADDIKASSFTLNLSNAQSPVMELFYSINVDEESDNSYSSSRYSVKCSGEERTKMTLMNINNTVVEFSDSAKIYDVDDSEDVL